MIPYRQIEIESYAKVTAPDTFGKVPRLEWIAIRDLVIDPEYQRDITLVGRKNVRGIAANFNWSMFAPVVVAPVGSNRYAIVDGQHRTTAAALVGVDRVPCMVIEAARGEQASSFIAINGSVTKMSSMQLYHAAVLTGDERATKIAGVCKAAGVTVLRYPKPINIISVGETMAIVVIARAIDKFGADVVSLALAVIRAAGGGVPGALKGQVIFGTSEVLHDHKEWRDERALTNALCDTDLEAMLRQAGSEAANMKGVSITDRFEAALIERLDAFFKIKKKAEAR